MFPIATVRRVVLVVAAPLSLGVSSARGLEFVYWTDSELGVIQRAQLNGGNLQQVRLGELMDFTHVARGGSWIVWYDDRRDRIVRADSQTHAFEVIHDNMHGPISALAVDAPGNHVYWRAANKIWRADLDGANVTEFRSDAWGGGLAADPVNDYLYWGDKQYDGAFNQTRFFMYRVPLSGGSRETLGGFIINGPTPEPYFGHFTLDVTRQRLYFMYENDLYRVNTDGSNLTTIDENVATNAVAVDEVRQFLYVGDAPANQILRFDLDGNNAEIFGPTDVEDVDGLAVDGSTGDVLWTQDGPSALVGVGASGTDPVVLLEASDYRTLAYHRGLNRLYWFELATRVIEFADADGGGDVTLFADTAPYSAVEITIDEAHGKVYWYAGGSLYRADLEGQNAEDLGSLSSSPGDLEIDLPGQWIYWTHRFTDEILRSRLTAEGGLGEAQTLYTATGGTERFRLALLHETSELIWSQWTSIKRGSMDGTAPVTDGPTDMPGISGVRWNPTDQKVYWASHNGKVRRASFGGPTATIYDELPSVSTIQDLALYTETVTGVSATPPASTILPVVVPNPFAAHTTVRVDLTTAGRVDCRLFDVGGRLVRALVDDRFLPVGTHRLFWDGTNAAGSAVPPGVYRYRLDVGGSKSTGSVVRLP